MKPAILILLPLLLATSTIQAKPSADSSPWPGQWIAMDKRYVPEHSDVLENTPWIWLKGSGRARPDMIDHNPEAYFRKTFQIAHLEGLTKAICTVTADQELLLFVNDQQVTSDDEWWRVEQIDLLPFLKAGGNQLAVRVRNYLVEQENQRNNTGNPAGLIMRLLLEYRDGKMQEVATDGSWLANREEEAGWKTASFNDSDWNPADTMSKQGMLDWQGQNRQANRWYCYRKTVTLDSLPETMQARIAVDSKYWLWINGDLAVFEGGVKRGPDRENTYYDTVDLRPYFRTGENTIAILAWYWGRHGFSHNSSGQHGLYLDLDTGKGTIATDGTWKVRQHPAFGKSSPPYPNYRLPEFNIHFDASADIAGWQSPGYDDSQWLVATELGSPPVSPWNELVDRRIPQWADSGLLEYPDSPDFPFLSNGDPVELRLPHNAMVTPWFKIRSPEGLVIDLRMDNYLGGSENNIRAEYVTRDGVQSFETPAWMNGHKVRYSFPKGIEILDLKYRETAFNAPVKGSFTCDDPRLNELWKRSLRTLMVCMRDTYFDCPDRERAQWWGDAVIEIGQTFYALDRVSDTLTQKAILELVHWQREDHTLFSPVPSGSWNAELPGQMLMSIGYYGFWTYYLHSGDKDTIQQAYPYLKHYLELWEMDPDGLVSNRKGDWYWGDWGKNKDTRILDNCYYALALLGADKMAELTGHDEDRPFYRNRYASIKDNFDRVFWNGSSYRSPDYKGETDDRGHGLAVLAGLAAPENHEAIVRFLVNNQHASPYTEKYILEALFQMGYPQVALDRMLRRYRSQLETDYTTLFEGWGIGKEGFGGGTTNHSWSGGPLTLLSEYVGGVSPLDPAYRTFHVKPAMGDLKEVAVVVPSIRGEIRSSVKMSKERILQEVTVPNGSEARIYIPIPRKAFVESIRINDHEASHGSPDIPGIHSLRNDGDAPYLLAGPGTYRIVTSIR